MHRETTISREIKLLKNKFELLEKNRQFRSILQKSSNNSQTSNSNVTCDTNDDLTNGLDHPNVLQRTKSEAISETDSFMTDKRQASLSQQKLRGSKNVRIKLSKLNTISRLFAPLFRNIKAPVRVRRKSNKISSVNSYLTSSLVLESSAEHKQQPVASDSGDIYVRSVDEVAPTTSSINNKEMTSPTATTTTESNKKQTSKGALLIGRLFKKT